MQRACRALGAELSSMTNIRDPRRGHSPRYNQRVINAGGSGLVFRTMGRCARRKRGRWSSRAIARCAKRVMAPRSTHWSRWGRSRVDLQSGHRAGRELGTRAARRPLPVAW